MLDIFYRFQYHTLHFTGVEMVQISILPTNSCNSRWEMDKKGWGQTAKHKTLTPVSCPFRIWTLLVGLVHCGFCYSGPAAWNIWSSRHCWHIQKTAEECTFWSCLLVSLVWHSWTMHTMASYKSRIELELDRQKIRPVKKPAPHIHNGSLRQEVEVGHGQPTNKERNQEKELYLLGTEKHNTHAITAQLQNTLVFDSWCKRRLLSTPLKSQMVNQQWMRALEGDLPWLGPVTRVPFTA